MTSLVPVARPGSGYDIANRAVVDGLRRAGVRVTCIGFREPGAELDNPDDTILLADLHLRTEDAGLARQVAWVGAALRRRLPVSSAKLTTFSPQALRSAMAQAGDFDAYVLNGVTMAGAFEALFSDKPTLYVAHNVEHGSAQENARAVSNPAKAMLFRREARLLRALEKRLCERADTVFVLAAEDAVALGVPDEKAEVLPLVMPEPAVIAAPRPLEHDLGLLGTWTWQPNRIGLDWFLNDVAPRLTTQPAIAIAGAVPADLPPRHPGIRFVGRVPDAAAFLGASGAVPLVSRAGTGVQLKTIETFELGLPSVATALSLRGIAARPENCVMADDAPSFAAALDRMIAAARQANRQQIDGGGFRAAQLAAMDRAIGRGLDRLRLPK